MKNHANTFTIEDSARGKNLKSVTAVRAKNYEK